MFDLLNTDATSSDRLSPIGGPCRVEHDANVSSWYNLT